MRNFRNLLLILICCMSMSLTAQHQVCFTVDDLPLQRINRFSPSELKDISGHITSTFVKYKVPAIGFVNEKNLYKDGELDHTRVALLQTWLDKGLELGNHTFSHPNYNDLTLGQFVNEIRKGQEITGKMCEDADRPIRYFRHPYLIRGNSREKTDSLAQYLNSAGYSEAPVTIDNSEWIFGAAYDSVSRTHNQGLIDSIGSNYIRYIEAKVHYFESMSDRLFGRNIKQIMLIHANALNGEFLDELLEMFVSNGYRFISLEEALKDEAYKSDDHYFGNSGISWLDRWALTLGYKEDFFKGEPTAPDFVKKLAKVKYE
jgi:peptidoglycan/xylan/chitin deacetylase (PgdA/CDA1 family)